MKKTNKLLSLFIVIAMIASTMVMPMSVSAATNLFVDGTFESYTTTDEINTLLAGEGAGNHDYTLMTDGGANSTSNYVKVSNRQWQGSNFSTNSITVEEGKKYVATMYLKSVSGTFNVTPVIAYTGNGSSFNGTPVEINSTTWTPATVELEAKAEYVGAWGQSVVIKLTETSGAKHDICIDEVSLVEYVEAAFPEWGSFEGYADLAATGVTGSGATVALATDGNGANSTSNYIKVTGRGYQGANISTPAVTIEEGKAYKATFYVRLADGIGDTQVTPQVNYTGNGTIFSGAPVTAKAGEWTQCEVEFAATADFAGRWGQSIVMKAHQAGTLDLWYDEFKLEEISKPALTTTHNLASTTNVDTDAATEITVDISNDAYNFSGKNDPTNSGVSTDQVFTNLAQSNFVLSGGAGSVAVVVNSNKQATLTLTGLAKNTTYSIAINGVTDYFGNTATSQNIVTFTTEAAGGEGGGEGGGGGTVPPTPSGNLISNGSFENTTSATLSDIINGSGWTVALNEDAANARTGSKSISVTASTYQGASANTAWFTGILQTGTTYKMTAYVKLHSGTANTVFAKIRDTSNNLYVQGGSVGANATEWTPVTVVFEATSPNVQIQFFNHNRVDYYLDDMSIEAYVPPVPVWSTLEDLTTLSVSSAFSVSGYTAEIIEDAQIAHGGSKYLSVTNRGYQGANMASMGVNIEPGKSYRAKFYTRLASDGETKYTPRINYTGSGAVFSGEAVTVTDDAWTECVVEFKDIADFQGKWGATVAFGGFQAGTLDMLFDDFTLEEITTPSLTIDTSENSDLSDVAVNGTIVVEFSNSAYNFSGKNDPGNTGVTTDQVFSNLNASNFVLEGGSGSMTVNPKSATRYELELSGLTPVTDYTISLVGVTDYFGNTITDEINFSTSPYIFVQLGNILENGDQSGNSYNPSFELPDTFQTTNFHDGTVRGTDFDADIVPAADEGIEAIDGDNIFKITNRNVASNPNVALRLCQVPGMQLGYRYQVSYWIRTINPGETLTARAYFSRTAVGNNAVMPGTIEQATVNVDNEWTKVTGIVELAEDTAGKPNLGIHIGVETYGNADIYVDDIRLEQMIPLPELTSDMVNKASNVSTDTELVLTCSNPFSYAGVVPSDITLTKEDGTEVTGVVSTKRIDDSNYKVILTGLDTATKYILTASGIKDVYRQDMNDLVINFSTTIATNVLADYGTNFSFEEGDSKGTISNATGTIVEAAAEGIAAPHGSKYLKVTDRTGAEGTQKFTEIGVGAGLEDKRLEAGKEYELSFYIRTLPDSEGNATTDTASAFFQNAGTANTIKLGAVTAESFNISSGNWTKVTGRVKIVADNTSGTYQGINIGFSTGGRTSVYIDRYELKECFPEFTVTTTPADGSVAITTETIKFNFSNPLKEDMTLGSPKFTITPAAPILEVTKISATEYDVTFDFDYNTEYTIEFEDLEDDHFQFVSEVITFTTSTGGGAADNNILEQMGYNWTFEGQEDGSVVPGVEYVSKDGGTYTLQWSSETGNGIPAPEVSTNTGYNSSSSVLISDTDPQAVTWQFLQRRARLTYVPMDDGKTYVVSAMVKLYDAGETDSAQISFDLAGGAASNLILSANSPKVEINGETWTKVTATVSCKYKTATVTPGTRTEAHVQIYNDTIALKYYIDDVIIYEVPSEDFVMTSSTPADNAEDVSVSAGTIRLDYSHSLDEAQDLTADGLVTIWKGETNITDDILTGPVVAGFGNKSIEIPVDVLEYNTNYTVKVSGLKDFAGREAADHEITFKTSNAVGYSDFVLLDGAGQEITASTMTVAQAANITDISVNVSNLTPDPSIETPLIIYTIYGSDGMLDAVKSSPFAGTLATDSLLTLGVDAADISLIESGSTLTIYVVNSYKNMSLVAPPKVIVFN